MIHILVYLVENAEPAAEHGVVLLLPLLLLILLPDLGLLLAGLCFFLVFLLDLVEFFIEPVVPLVELKAFFLHLSEELLCADLVNELGRSLVLLGMAHLLGEDRQHEELLLGVAAEVELLNDVCLLSQRIRGDFNRRRRIQRNWRFGQFAFQLRVGSGRLRDFSAQLVDFLLGMDSYFCFVDEFAIVVAVRSVFLIMDHWLFQRSVYEASACISLADEGPWLRATMEVWLEQ